MSKQSEIKKTVPFITSKNKILKNKFNKLKCKTCNLKTTKLC